METAGLEKAESGILDEETQDYPLRILISEEEKLLIYLLW